MVKDRGFPTVFIIRMAIFPPSLMNYFLSITSVSFLAYFWGTILGMTPGVAVLSIAGTVALKASKQEESMWLEITLIVSLIITVIASLVMMFWARRAIKQYKEKLKQSGSYRNKMIVNEESNQETEHLI